MLSTSEPTIVYLLADNLDAALAAGEDLLNARFDLTSPATGPAIFEHIGERHRFVDRMRALELTLVQRVLRAREHASQLAASDHRFKAIATLFAGGTAALLDTVAELDAHADLDGRWGQDTVAYIRSRGMIDLEAAGLDGLAEIRATETFLVAERIALGPLLDLLATFLDALELHFELFAEPGIPELPQRSLADVIAALR